MRCFRVAVVGASLRGIERGRSGREAEKRTVTSKDSAPSFSGLTSSPRWVEGMVRCDMDHSIMDIFWTDERAGGEASDESLIESH